MEAYFGEVLALLTAIAWAFAVILFKKSGEAVHPIGLNLFKNTLSAVLLVPSIYLLGDSLFHPAPIQDYILFLASGALGIGLSDTLFFKSLNILGAGLSAIVDCLYSPFIIALSTVFLAESLGAIQIVGVLMIVFAVLTATSERKSNSADGKTILKGVIYGVLAMATNAAGIVMIKPALERSPLFWVTEIRLVGGAIVLLIVLLLHKHRREIVRSIFSAKRWVYTLSGSFIGAYLAMLLWLAGMKYTQASVASALNQTSNIFIFIFAALLLREKITVYRLTGIIFGVCGAILVMVG